MRIINRRRWWFAGAGAALVLSAGITMAVTVPTSSAPPTRTITVAALPAVDLAGLYIAQADGLFAQQGLHVIIKTISSTAAIIGAQEQGQVDVAAGAYVPYLAAEAAGGRFRILAPASSLQPNVRELMITRTSAITSLSGLAGKTVGVNGTNSVGTLLTDILLSSHGMSPQSVRFITDPDGFPGLPVSLQAGKYAVAYFAEPYITSSEFKGIHSLADLDQGGAQGFQMDGYVATDAWVQKNPETAAAFIRAIEQGQAIAHTDSPAVRSVVAQYDHLSQQTAYLMALPGYPLGGPDASAIQSEAEDMLQFGMIDSSYAPEVTTGKLTAQITQPVSPGTSS